MFQHLAQSDGTVLVWLQDLMVHDSLTPFVIFITKLGDAGMIWIIASVILLFPKRTRLAGIMSLLALLGSLIVNNILLKNLIARTRPYEVVDGVRLLIEKQSDYSFPSGHTGSSFAAAVTLFWTLPKKYGVPAMVLAFLIGISRLYLGVHYPLDVLCGALFGTMTAVLICSIVRAKPCSKKD